MGLLGTVFSTIFRPNIPQTTTVVQQLDSVSGYDLVKNTESLTPESPSMGAETSKKGGSGGVSSLLVPAESLYHKSK